MNGDPYDIVTGALTAVLTLVVCNALGLIGILAR